MARYTYELREIMTSQNGTELLNKALSTYPLYEPKNTSNLLNIPNRSELNQRLLNAYKYREIGFETVGRFLDELQIVMCEIMPYYNDMYKTVEIMAELENPFDNVDFIESYQETRTGTAINKDTIEHSGTVSGENSGSLFTESSGNTSATDKSSSSSSLENFSKKVTDGTPQGTLSISANNIDSVNHAENVEWNKNTGSDTSSTSGESSGTSSNTTDQTTTSTNQAQTSDSTDANGTRTTSDTIEHTFTKKGNQGVNTYAHDMIEFRTSIIDVTNMIINDERVSELFLRVF